MNIGRMAWRNVWRNRRRSLVTISAMSFALFTMILYAGLIEGYLIVMERNVLDLELGDMQVFAQDYRKSPSLHKRIENDAELLARLDEVGYPASGRLLGSGLAAAGDASAGVMFRGLDVERDARVSDVHSHVIEGAWLDPSDPHGVVLGKRLAKILGVELGAEVVVLSQGADGSMANEVYRVRGVLKSIADGVDRAGVFMVDEAFRELMVVPDGVHQIIVRRPVAVELDVAAIEARGLIEQHEVKTWRELMPTLAQMIDTSRGAMFAMYIIVYLAIGIVILNAMLMAVFERIREFGVLKALGVGPSGVLRLIFVESAIMSVIALAVGGSLSIPGLWYLNEHGIDLTAFTEDVSIAGIAWDPVWKAHVNEHTFVEPIVWMIIIVTIAVLYPAIRAAVIRPVEAMRHR